MRALKNFYEVRDENDDYIKEITYKTGREKRVEKRAKIRKMKDKI